MARTQIVFEDAVREQIPARVAIFGPSGSGKSYTALLIGQVLAEGGPLFVIDTEHGRSRLYADKFPHKQYPLLPPHHPDHYINALNAAAAAGAKCVVMDGISPEWNGEGGVQEIVDGAKARFGGNTHSAWSVGTPLHNKFLEAILAAPFHVVCTMRSKVEWVIEEDSRGKKTPRKVGTAPVQRDTIEYEFDVCLLMDNEHNATIVKSHAGDIFPDGGVVEQPGVEFGTALLEWLGAGADATPRPAAAAVATAAKERDERVVAPEASMDLLMETVQKMQEDFGDAESGISWIERIDTRAYETFGVKMDEMTEDEVDRLVRSLNAARKQKTEETKKAAATA